jgi:hypothetical protein
MVVENNNLPYKVDIIENLGNKIKFSVSYNGISIVKNLSYFDIISDNFLNKEIIIAGVQLYKKIFGENQFDKIFGLRFIPNEMKLESDNIYKVWYKKYNGYDFVEVKGGLKDIIELLPNGGMYGAKSALPMMFIDKVYMSGLNDKLISIPLTPIFIEKK